MTGMYAWTNGVVVGLFMASISALGTTNKSYYVPAVFITGFVAIVMTIPYWGP